MTLYDIRLGVPDAERRRAAEIYIEAFASKIGPFLRPAALGIEAVATDLGQDRAFVALRDGQVVGIAGFHHQGRSLMDLQWPTFRRTYGPLRGTCRLAGLWLLSRIPPPDTLLMDGIVVAPSARGQGLGTRLLDALSTFAEDQGYQRIQLDVVDTNPGARRLYERCGFEPVATHRYGPLTRWMGFSASTTMVRHLSSS